VTQANNISSKAWLTEWPLALAIITFVAALFAKDSISSAVDHPVLLIIWLLFLCFVILSAAIAIVRHADVLAHRLGEPYGTLLLTLAVTGLEVAVVAFVMSAGEPKPSLARDTIFAVVMLVMNGFLGLALLLGGLRHREQSYNLQSANSFLILILPLTVLGLVMPNYTRATAGPVLSVFQMVDLCVMSIAIYATFLWVQTRRHRSYFVQKSATPQEDEPIVHDTPSPYSSLYHAIMLGLYGLPLVLLAKQMALPLDAMVSKLGAPPALSGFVTAMLVLAPESIAAIRAAMDNKVQRSVNVLLGSVLASIGLTIPLVIAVTLITGQQLILGLDQASTVMLVLTLVTSMLTFAQPRTNMLLGCVHLLLFGAYFMLMFDR
jgi:Ca2+:H+ antiporter